MPFLLRLSERVGEVVLPLTIRGVSLPLCSRAGPARPQRKLATVAAFRVCSRDCGGVPQKDVVVKTLACSAVLLLSVSEMSQTALCQSNVCSEDKAALAQAVTLQVQGRLRT